MRILWHSPPPWTPGGYGQQTRFNVPKLIEHGHEVAISAYAGVHEEREWNGIPILAAGRRSYGNGQIAFNYNRWKADILVLLLDLECVEPTQLGPLRVHAWEPVDTDPLGMPTRHVLQGVYDASQRMLPVQRGWLRPIAMSKFGQEMLRPFNDGWGGQDAPLVYHGIDTDLFRPDPEAGREWRKRHKLPPEMFLISMIGVNSGTIDRKGFIQTLQAFKTFSDKRKDTALYLHTEAQNELNLAHIALTLDLKGRVLFTDQEERMADVHGDDFMVGLYNASNLYSQCSKGEGFGLPVIEAMACGVPVVASRYSAQTELVPSGTGFLVGGQKEWPPHHQSWWLTPYVPEIIRAYDKAYASWKAGTIGGMNRSARKWAKNFDIDVTSQAWKGILG